MTRWCKENTGLLFVVRFTRACIDIQHRLRDELACTRQTSVLASLTHMRCSCTLASVAESQ